MKYSFIRILDFSRVCVLLIACVCGSEGLFSTFFFQNPILKSLFNVVIMQLNLAC